VTDQRRGLTDDDSRVFIVGTVLEQLPHGLYRIGIERQRPSTGSGRPERAEGRQVTAHAPSGPGKNFVRVLVGDRVRLELSPRDLTRGRIVEKIA
jgi:translation initiation factor IF-1